MNRTLELPDELYRRLELAAKRRGLNGIEALLENWQADDVNIPERVDAVNRIDELQARLHAKYGPMPDSADLVREDRER